MKTQPPTVPAPDSTPAPQSDPYALILVSGCFDLVLEAAAEVSS